jgi:hypothetical protein
VSVAVFETVPVAAVIVEVVEVVTAMVLTVNETEVAPAGIVTAVGTEAEVPLAARVTVRPPLGAAPVIVTVPVDEFPPTTDVGFRLTPLTVGA